MHKRSLLNCSNTLHHSQVTVNICKCLCNPTGDSSVLQVSSVPKCSLEMLRQAGVFQMPTQRKEEKQLLNPWGLVLSVKWLSSALVCRYLIDTCRLLELCYTCTSERTQSEGPVIADSHRRLVHHISLHWHL